MALPSIPTVLINDIIRRVGKYGFRYLGPFIAAGPSFALMVSMPPVLREVDLEDFIYDMSLANESSIYRPFLLDCFYKGNITATYVEGFRHFVQVEPTFQSLDMIRVAVPHSLNARCAYGILLICGGQLDDGLREIESFLEKVSGIAEAVTIADQVETQIKAIGRPTKRIFNGYMFFADFPICNFNHLMSLDICVHCFGFIYAHIFYQMC